MRHLPVPFDVSRETIERLQFLLDRLRQWTSKINLISAASSPDAWDRHIIDSAQIYPMAPPFMHWTDLGSGGGLPGLVIAVIAKELNPEAHLTLIESDARKGVFLRATIAELDLPAKVLTTRIESAAPQDADVVSARALAALPDLLPLVHRHLSRSGTALLMKGARYTEELNAVRDDWHFDLTEHPSITHPDARILSFKRISRAT